jgi:hypothetical protein
MPLMSTIGTAIATFTAGKAVLLQCLMWDASRVKTGCTVNSGWTTRSGAGLDA